MLTAYPRAGGGECTRGPIVVWDVPWRMPFARLLNDLAIDRDRRLLLGVCEGAVGRLGPYVLPRNTACLECVQSDSTLGFFRPACR